MKLFTEKKAEYFLEKNDFKILEGVYVKNKKDLAEKIERVGFPCAMKISGKDIIHKKKLGGVEINIKDVEHAEKVFDRFKKIKGFEEALIQKQIKGKEFLLGIKKTPEFGHVICFGAGGSNVEQLGDVSFRACPIDKKEAEMMIKETKVSKGLLKQEGLEIEKNLLKLCVLVKKYPKLEELDINPLINGKIIDARIVFED